MRRKLTAAAALAALLLAAFLGVRTRSRQTSPGAFDPAGLPEYAGSAYVQINGNEPYFADDELTTSAFERYTPLDALGRCGPAYACVGPELMPTEPREPIGMIRPSGWHTVRYDDLVDGKYLYNRCHLLGYQLTGENGNPENLITGTRYLNIQGMRPFENRVAGYVRRTGSHVLYRVTPVFQGDDLLCSGVLMEARSVEDGGEGLCFCVYAYNVQPHIDIDYATGASARAQDAPAASAKPTATPTPTPSVPPSPSPGQADYIANKSTKRFHLPDCSGVAAMKEKNKLYYTGDREGLIDQGYEPCKQCKP